MEEWREIPTFEGLYSASTNGDIISHRGNEPRVLKPKKTKEGYSMYVFSVDNVRRCVLGHQMVIWAFKGIEPNGHNHQVHHIDGDKQHNALLNLEITNPRSHGLVHAKGKSKKPGIAWFKRNQKWGVNLWVDGKRKFFGLYETEDEAHKVREKALKELNIN